MSIGRKISFEDDDLNDKPINVSTVDPLPVHDVMLPMTAFNELAVAEVTPIVQYMSVYGFSAEKNDLFQAGDGVNSIKNRQYNSTSGTAVFSGSAILSKRRLTYKPGQGIVARFTSLFSAPQPGARLVAGLISATDRIGFGYDVSENFGIEYTHDGAVEIQKLTVTTAALGSENATVTVNGTAFTVPLTVGTINHNAFEIAESLSAQVPLYEFTSNQDEVTARADLGFPQGAFAFTSATAVAAWVQIKAGVIPNSDDFIKQSDFNGGIDLTAFDPTQGNVFQIQMQYLGFGALKFFIENSKTGLFQLVHTIRFANNNIFPSVVNPSFRVGIFAATALGAPASADLSMSSAFGGVEGKTFQTEPSRADDVEGTVTTVNRSILTLRNRITFTDLANRVELLPILLTIGTDANKPVIVEVIVDPIHIGDKIFSFIDENSSIAEIAFDQNVVTGGRLKYSFVLPSGGAAAFDLSKLRALMLPGEELSITARLASGGASAAVIVGLSWLEDL